MPSGQTSLVVVVVVFVVVVVVVIFRMGVRTLLRLDDIRSLPFHRSNVYTTVSSSSPG